MCLWWQEGEAACSCLEDQEVENRQEMESSLHLVDHLPLMRLHLLMISHVLRTLPPSGECCNIPGPPISELKSYLVL